MKKFIFSLSFFLRLYCIVLLLFFNSTKKMTSEVTKNMELASIQTDLTNAIQKHQVIGCWFCFNYYFISILIYLLTISLLNSILLVFFLFCWTENIGSTASRLRRKLFSIWPSYIIIFFILISFLLTLIWLYFIYLVFCFSFFSIFFRVR